MIFIVIDNGNGPPARIEISENKDGKLLSQLEWPNTGITHHSAHHSQKPLREQAGSTAVQMPIKNLPSFAVPTRNGQPTAVAQEIHTS